MTSVPLSSLAAAGLLACLGCASRGGNDAGAARYVFPERFEAQQVVRVGLEAREETFVALLRRSGPDLSVVLMEPFFFSPVVEISRAGGEVATKWYVEEPKAAGLAGKLMDALEELYLKADWTPEAAGSEGRAGGMFYQARLRGIAGAEGCRFPASLELRPSRGPAKRVVVDTETVRCGVAW